MHRLGRYVSLRMTSRPPESTPKSDEIWFRFSWGALGVSKTLWNLIPFESRPLIIFMHSWYVLENSGIWTSSSTIWFRFLVRFRKINIVGHLLSPRSSRETSRTLPIPPRYSAILRKWIRSELQPDFRNWSFVSYKDIGGNISIRLPLVRTEQVSWQLQSFRI